jgi:predicted transposase YbfD/YdcC
MDGPATDGPLRFFRDLPDPRARNVRHRLIDILVIALCAVICDADGWDDFEDFAESKAGWFETFLDLAHGVPSADTFRRVLSSLDPDAFEAAFTAWMAGVVELSAGKLVAVDGKSIRRSFERSWDKAGMAHMVSLFASANGQVLAQYKADGKGGEFTGLMHLLGMTELRGATVTVDALGCQKQVAQRITDRGGKYVLAVKDNQPLLHAAVRSTLDELILLGFAGVRHGFTEETDTGHGRIEHRRVWVTDDLSGLGQAGEWPGLASLAVVEARREVHGGETSTERRYYITSLPGTDATAIAAAVRGHWAVENGLHHVLDVTFHEDDSRIRRGHGAENVSRLRRIALNLLKVNGDKHTKRKSIRGRRKIAGWDHNFLLRLIAG